MMRASLLCRTGLFAVAVGMLDMSLGLVAEAPPKKIRVIYTNDLRGFLEPCG